MAWCSTTRDCSGAFYLSRGLRAGRCKRAYSAPSIIPGKNGPSEAQAALVGGPGSSFGAHESRLWTEAHRLRLCHPSLQPGGALFVAEFAMRPRKTARRVSGRS